jgi:hypothetical protein
VDRGKGNRWQSHAKPPPISPLRRKGIGAGEEIRTLDIFLGKEVLYQLSYARVNEARKVGELGARAQGDFSKFSMLPAALLTATISGYIRIMLRVLLLALVIASPLLQTVHALTPKELDSIGRKVWQNECGGSRDGLTSWNAGEGFASLGIGHFIWYPKGMDGPYEESFPGLVGFLRENGARVPGWLKADTDCPWNSKADFQADFRSERMNELRDLLASTIREQSRFLALRMQKALPKLLAEAPAAKRDLIRDRFQKLAGSGKGTFALIDYVNFKGEGTNPNERYRGEGWGMLQVLEGMDDGTDPVKAFSDSAASVLARRVKNAAPKDETRWLKGWTSRVRGYAE